MSPSPIFETPLVRALLRTLLFAVILEALFYRLLEIPAGPRWAGLRESTGRAGSLMFFLAFVILIPTLVAVAYATLRHPAWPGLSNGFVSIGLLTLSALAVSASMGPSGSAFAAGFTLLSLAVCLAMLAGLFEACRDPRVARFSVALACALTCFALAEAGGLAASMGLVPRAPAVITAGLSAGWWLLFAAGALAFFAFEPGPALHEGPVLQLAAYGLPAASAFGLVFGAIFQPQLLGRLAPALGTAGASLTAGVIKTTAAGAALFLAGVTALRGLASPRLRAPAIGLILLVLAGYPREVAYQHLVTVLGVILITGSAPPLPVRARPVPAAAGRPGAIPDPPAPGRTIPVHLEPPPGRDG